MHMLTTAISQLRATSSKRQYGEAANLLEAVANLLQYFKPYGDVERIRDLNVEVEQIREKIELEVFEAFVAIGHLAGTMADTGVEAPQAAPGGFQSIGEACAVVDALGDDARARQVAAFVARQLEPYAFLFPKGGQGSGLDDVERRFSWVRRLLRTFGEKYGTMFPRPWRVERRLVLLFVDQTRAMFLEILASGDPDSENVTVVLKALQKSLVFEKEAQARFDDEYGASRKRGGRDDDAPSKPQPRRFGDDSAALLAAAEKAAKALEEEKPVLGLLSTVFDPFMGPYVLLERKNMDEMMSKVSAEEQVDRDGALPVLSSSVHMFAYIKTSVRRCTALTTGQTFYKLHLAFCDCLRDYAARLRLKLAENLDAHSAVEAACYALNTAEYCAETVEQLAEIVKGKIDGAYVGKVDLDAEQEGFHGVISAAVKKLVMLFEASLEPALKSMAATNWGSVEVVDDESPYVRTMITALRICVPAARDLLSSTYFRNLCDKFAASFLPKFHARLTRLKRINEMGTHQLLLDVHSLKPCLAALPALKALDDSSESTSAIDSSKPAAPATYVKFVLLHVSKLEMLLKLVGTPTEMLVERFKIMWPSGPDAELAHELATIIALKGITKKVEMQHLMDTFSGTAAPKPNAGLSTDKPFGSRGDLAEALSFAKLKALPETVAALAAAQPRNGSNPPGAASPPGSQPPQGLDGAKSALAGALDVGAVAARTNQAFNKMGAQMQYGFKGLGNVFNKDSA